MKRQFTELELIRREKVKKLQENKVNPWSRDVNFTDNSKTLKKKFQHFSKEELLSQKEIVSTIFRVMIKRGPFIVGKDSFGSIQVFIPKKEHPEINDFIKNIDIGDFIFVEGSMMKTDTGELTIRSSKAKLIVKSLKPLPEKFHGLKDVEERYRRRYLDLIMNDEVKETFLMRNKIISSIRQYFNDLDYFEAETPILQPILGGASAKPFTTHHNALSMDFYLRIATELPLKKLLVGGFDKVYEIGRLFRNEGIDTTHNPEFTTIEFYQAYLNLEKMMELTENLLQFVTKQIKQEKIIYKNTTIDFSKKFKRIKMVEAINAKTGKDFYTMNFDEAKNLAKEYGFKVEPFFQFGHIINLFFEELIEKEIVEPTFITEYPIEISPLAAKKLDDPRFTERAELFIMGKEYANLFTELNDPLDQYERFLAQVKEKESGNEEASEIDIDFIEALEYGMPPAGGCGLGIDRLVMLLTNKTSIREVLLFPHLKNKEKNE